MLRHSLRLSLDGVPASIELDEVSDYLTGLPASARSTTCMSGR